MASPIDPSEDGPLFWWGSPNATNFGDYLSKVVVERLAHVRLPDAPASLSSNRRLLLAVGSIIHFARDGDVVWGSGFRESPLREDRRYRTLDVRAVRGPISRDDLLQMGIACPEVYGDPALLLPRLCPNLPPVAARPGRGRGVRRASPAPEDDVDRAPAEVRGLLPRDGP